MATVSGSQIQPTTPLPDGKGAAMRVAATSDIDEQAALLRGWNQTYDQMSAGSFNGSFLEVELDGVLLFREITSNSLHQTGALPAGTIAVGVPMALRGKATFCRRRCDGTQLHVFSGADAFEFLSPCGLDMAGFVLTESDLEVALTNDEWETLLPSLSEPHLRSTGPGAADLMRRIFADACEVVALCPDLADDPRRLASMSRDVVATLVTALSRAPGDRPDIPPGKHARIVRDARDLVNAWPDGDMSVAELCRMLGVSRRGLQYAFQETLGVKPSTYLRAVRLNGARRAIKHTHSVAEAATRWGFWHFGRFAHDYKAMFGELPSEAFRRYHSRAAPRIPDHEAAARPSAQKDHRR